MSAFQKCPYTNEECTYEIYSLSLGIPRFNTCDKCSVFTSRDEVKEDHKVGHKSDSEVIAELKKENEKLKEKLGDVQMQKASEKSDFVWKLKTANEQKAEQLAKAKEIIRKYYKYNPSCEYSYEDIDKQAEQFLKEIK